MKLPSIYKYHFIRIFQIIQVLSYFYLNNLLTCTLAGLLNNSKALAALRYTWKNNNIRYSPIRVLTETIVGAKPLYRPGNNLKPIGHLSFRRKDRIKDFQLAHNN